MYTATKALEPENDLAAEAYQ